MTDVPRPDLPPTPRCWCGNAELRDFSPDYLRCEECDTLVVRAMQGEEISQVEDDESAFYGKNYYLHHVQEDYGLPDLETRARADLPERCTHWLRTFLKFAPVPTPGGEPVRTLELGCGHGGFVAMLRWAGYEATGLELSPWLTDRAREWFDVPMLTGRLEDQAVPPGSLDAVMLMDVLEHLPDPRGTMAAAARLLRPGGFLLVQTPCFPAEDGPDYAAMVAQNHPFLVQLKPMEHLYLFSKKAARRLFAELGLGAVEFERPIFDHYDMFFTASAAPRPTRDEPTWTAQLADPALSPGGRGLLAIMDAAKERDRLTDFTVELEREANIRLAQVRELGPRLAATEAAADARTGQIEELTLRLNDAEAGRTSFEQAAETRLTQVEALTSRLRETEAARTGFEQAAAARLAQTVELNARLATREAESARLHEQILEVNRLWRAAEDAANARVRAIETEAEARLALVHELTRRLEASETDRAARLELIERLSAELAELRADHEERGRQVGTLTDLVHDGRHDFAVGSGAGLP